MITSIYDCICNVRNANGDYQLKVEASKFSIHGVTWYDLKKSVPSGFKVSNTGVDGAPAPEKSKLRIGYYIACGVAITVLVVLIVKKKKTKISISKKRRYYEQKC